ncbi:MAG: hypothetical protein GC162_06105 [Planctomycetes bacterium]|nr:hypothetical protein [Planctomycetota bacterium]
MSHLRRICLLACLLAALVLFILPRAARADETADLFNQVYGPKLKAAQATPQRDDDLALARDLLTAAAREKPGSPMIPVLCQNAYDLTKSMPEGYDTAVDAMSMLADAAPDKRIDAWNEAVAIRTKQYAIARGPDKASAGEAVLLALQHLADAEAAAGDAKSAVRDLRRASTLARAIQSPYADAIASKLDAATRQVSIQSRLAILEPKINAGDPAALQQAVMLHLVDLDDPAAALALADKLSDDALRQHIQSANKPISELDSETLLNEALWYRDLAAKADDVSRRFMLSRSLTYLNRYIDQPAVDKDKARLFVSQVSVDLDKVGGYAPPAMGRLADIKPNEWIDLLPDIDFDRGPIKGKWSKAPDGVACEAMLASRIELPLEISGSYQLHVEFSMGAALEAVFIAIPVNDRIAMIVLGGGSNKIAFIRSIDGKNNRESPVFCPFSLSSGRKYSVDITVLRLPNAMVHISTRVDGETIIDWQGASSRLSMDPFWQMGDPHAPGLGANTSMVYNVARVRMIEGHTRRIQKSDGAGGGGGTRYTRTPSDAGMLIGLRYGMHGYFGIPVIGVIEPIFMTPAGQTIGLKVGKGKTDHEIVAKPGYFISDINLRGGERLDGFQLVFMRMTARGPDPKDTYQSDWQGGTGGSPKSISGNGQPVVGIHGKAGEDIDSLGVVFVPVSGIKDWGERNEALVVNGEPIAETEEPQNDAASAVSVKPAKETQKSVETTKPGEPVNAGVDKPRESKSNRPTFFGVPID